MAELDVRGASNSVRPGRKRWPRNPARITSLPRCALRSKACPSTSSRWKTGAGVRQLQRSTCPQQRGQHPAPSREGAFSSWRTIPLPFPCVAFGPEQAGEAVVAVHAGDVLTETLLGRRLRIRNGWSNSRSPFRPSWRTMEKARRSRSGWPWGKCPDGNLGGQNSMAEALGGRHAQAPQPMQAAASMAASRRICARQAVGSGALRCSRRRSRRRR